MDVVAESPWDHRVSCQHSQSALIGSHTAGKLCGRCGLALHCVFVSCGRHVVNVSKEAAILYSSRTVAQHAAPPPPPFAKYPGANANAW